MLFCAIFVLRWLFLWNLKCSFLPFLKNAFKPIRLLPLRWLALIILISYLISVQKSFFGRLLGARVFNLGLDFLDYLLFFLLSVSIKLIILITAISIFHFCNMDFMEMWFWSFDGWEWHRWLLGLVAVTIEFVVDIGPVCYWRWLRFLFFYIHFLFSGSFFQFLNFLVFLLTFRIWFFFWFLFNRFNFTFIVFV